MQEQSLFIAALEKEDAAERAAFLDQACAGDPELRQRLDRLLEQHRRAGGFLETPAVACVAAAIAAAAGSGDTEPPGDEDDAQALDFLVPADQPGVLGRLGHYQVLEVVGKGGMGIVLRAFDEQLRRVVAIKVMAPALAANATARKRFIREAQAAAAVRNDHVIGIHTVEEASTPPYLVMEFISGQSLQERLDQTGALGLKEILRIGMQTALGLAAAHQQGLIHRDVKPANILLENGVERVKITDFGMARAAADASLTQCGVVAGTPQYMSPEQARGEPVDARTDLFSLGSVLYAMGTGRAPFRASGSLAVLKRVCEETPTPIREANPEIPDWLMAIIAKLHAKDPAERFQSAAEVAELLGRHLAQLQQPSLGDGGLLKSAIRNPQSAMVHRRWAIAAALVLLLFGGLSLTEATGVTNLRATVIRIFTPDGTLVVEVDDPDVKVTVEGDGGLVITGAGLEEIRLRPGSYKVQADKDGKRVPLEKELVSIAKGGREVVRVKLEGSPTPPVVKVAKGAFVLLGGKGIEVRKCDTLTEAVQGASAGDTIEIRGNGPFVSEPINLRGIALTIRAGEGFRPVIQLSSNLRTDAPLVLEGLELQHLGQKAPQGHQDALVLSSGNNSLHVANCRFREHLGIPSIVAYAQRCFVRNCEFLNPHQFALVWSGKQCVIDNSLVAGHALQLENGIGPGRDGSCSVQLTRNTLAAANPLFFRVFTAEPPPQLAEDDVKPIRVEAAGNIFDATSVLVISVSPPFLTNQKPLQPNEAAALLPRFLSWRDRLNLYAPGGSFVSGYTDERVTIGATNLADWKRFWGPPHGDAIEGRVRYQGGNLVAKLRATPEKLTPDNFRLRADSAGYRAGKDGKDLGADVDLVGPGPAYERWKKMPEYQQWLKETGQIKAEASKPEPQAFVVLSSKGVEVRKYHTLTEAVQGASDVDTIEIRGNGPFVSEPISIQRTALTIRAGEGFRPVIKLSPEAVQRELPLLATNAALVLEGLELHRAPPDAHTSYTVVNTHQAPLRAANCRFRASIWAHQSPNCVFRNCEFLFEGGSIGLQHGSGARVMVENCLSRTNGHAIHLYYANAAIDDVSIQITRSTFASKTAPLALSLQCPAPAGMDGPQALKPIRLEVSRSVFDSSGILAFGQHKDFAGKGGTLPPAEAEAMFLRLLEWRGEQNLFPADSVSVHWWVDYRLQPPRGPKSLEEWKRFWKAGDADSLEGASRFQGGSLLSRTGAAIDQLTPDDFRLRPDSAGYRAGKDGKDLGADVDLVGPGPAYERWKQTPEYQQWLKDTGQIKAEAPKPEAKAFVVLAGNGIEVRKFDTLVEAVAAAHDGDTIEVRGNGPFVTDSINIQGRALTIRAGEGFRPVIKLSPEGVQRGLSLINTNAALVLEGLELQRAPNEDPTKGAGYTVVHTYQAPLRAANCRFSAPVWSNQSPVCVFRNCELVGAQVDGRHRPGGRFIFENCLHRTKGQAIGIYYDDAALDDVSIQIKRSTIVSNFASLWLSLRSPVPSDRAQNSRPIRLEVSECVLDTPAGVLGFKQHPDFLKQAAVLEPAAAEAALLRLLEWRGERNLFAAGSTSVSWFADEKQPPRGPKSLEEWKRFWSAAEADSQEGGLRFQGVNPLARASAFLDELTPDDFRLRPDSPGYRAGKDGKDLGADVDLVGPGAAYERWKQTAEYQQWLKDTGQTK